MSAQYPQVLEPHLDEILSGATVPTETMKSVLRQLLVIRRRYNDPDQVAGRRRRYDAYGWDGSYDYTAPNTMQGLLGGFVFSNFWSIDSQKARVEQGIAYLTPIVGAAVGDYPPAYGGFTTTHWRFDTMGNNIPPGKP